MMQEKCIDIHGESTVGDLRHTIHDYVKIFEILVNNFNKDKKLEQNGSELLSRVILNSIVQHFVEITRQFTTQMPVEQMQRAFLGEMMTINNIIDQNFERLVEINNCDSTNNKHTNIALH